MKKIFAIGESLVDIIFNDGQPVSAKAGGSMLNSAVSLGRTGIPVSFISEYGNDDPGNLINTFLRDNGVDTSLVYRYDPGQTAIALAFLDKKKNAHYSFYKNYPEERLKIAIPEISEGDIILFGSIYSIESKVRQVLNEIVKRASDNRATVLYDPNFRKSHIKELESLRPMIVENMRSSSIIRASNEDFRNIFNAKTADEAWKITKDLCSCLIYTANENGVFVRTDSFSGIFPVKKIKPVSTIGAGDTFNAGLMTSLYSDNIAPGDLRALGETEWRKIIGLAVEYATDVCLGYDNYIATGFAEKIRNTYF